MKKFFLVLTALFLINNAHAYEVKNVCAKYMTNYSWSQAYQVQTQIIQGKS